MEHFPPVYPFQEDKWFQLCKRLAQRAGFSCDDPESLETVLFRLYADMLGDTVRRLNQTPEKHRRLFFNQVQLPRLPARAGQGIAVFQIEEGYGKPVPIPEGTLLTAQSQNPEEKPVLFRVRKSFSVYPMKIEDIIWADASQDKACRVQGSFIPFSATEKGFGSHCLKLWFHRAFCGTEGPRQIRFTARCKQNGHWKPLETLADPQKYQWKLSSGNQETLLQVSPAGDSLLLQYEGLSCTGDACLSLESLDASGIGLELAEVQVFSRENEICPDRVITGDRQLEPSAFYPFGQPFTSCAECYIFCGNALYHPGAEITLTYDLEMECTQETLPAQPENIDFKWVMRRPLPKPEPEFYEAYPIQACWEYWNGSAYCPLTAVQDNIFSKPQKQVSFTFQCPEDMAPRDFDMINGYCLRLSCGICDALYKMPRNIYTPRIENLRFAYQMPGEPPFRAESENFGDKKLLQGIIRPFSGPPCEGKALFLGMDALPEKSTLRFLFHMDGFSPPGQPLEAFIEGSKGPCLLEDGPRGLTCSGMVTLQVPEHVIKTRLFGLERFWLRLEPSGKGTFPPILGIYPNAQAIENRVRHVFDIAAAQIPENRQIPLLPDVVETWVFCRSNLEDAKGPREELWKCYEGPEENFSCGFYRLNASTGLLVLPEQARFPYGDTQAIYRIYYDVSDGSKGNVPAGSISSLYEEIPFISRVWNPMPVVSGGSAESDEDLADRIAHLIHCGGRAVSPEDYALFACDFCPLVQKAKCIPGSPIQLAVLLEQPELSFPLVREELELLFKKYGCASLFGTQVEIIPAVPVPIQCTISLIENGVLPKDLHSRLSEELTRFVDPVYGGPEQEGWEIGSLPTGGQLRGKTAAFLKKEGLQLGDFSCQIKEPGIFEAPGPLFLEWRDFK